MEQRSGIGWGRGGVGRGGGGGERGRPPFHIKFDLCNHIVLDHTRTEKLQSRAIKAFNARMSCSFFLISLSGSAFNPLDSRLSAHIGRSTIGFVPECLEQVCALICHLGAEFRHLCLQLVNVLVENGSTLPGRKRRRRRLSPFIGRIIRRRTIITPAESMRGRRGIDARLTRPADLLQPTGRSITILKQFTWI